tara:strand:+ start:11187 stop:11696 length:510 start_codon:yes stop_codon:yes gene_type:complete
MVHPITKYGAAVLQTRASEITNITSNTQELIDDMVEAMYASSGIGLAAPQIGLSIRLFIADPSFGRDSDDLVVMINPEIVERDGIQLEVEGCLSLPGFEARIARPTRSLVRGLDRHGEPQQLEATGLLARIFQHEIDHLDGSLFLDHLRGLKRDLIIRKIKKLRRLGKW